MRPRLFGFEAAWTDAAFDTIFPENTVLPHGIARMNPARFVDDWLAVLPLEQSIGVRVSLWIVGLAPLFTIRRLATFASLSTPDRAKVLDKLLTSPIYGVRGLVLSLKAIATFLYAQSPAVRKAMITPLGAGPREAGSDLTSADGAESGVRAASERVPSDLVGLRTRPQAKPKRVHGDDHDHAAE
jgi:hypothetical protein